MLIRILLVVLATAAPLRAKEWRGILPLHATRADVERLLGPPSVDRSYITFYELEKEEVSFNYARGPCGDESSVWNVPRDTVTSIWVTPKRGSLKLNDLKLDESGYRKERDSHVWNIVNYINEVEGISYQVDTGDDGRVTLIKYFPAERDAHLRCPSPAEGLVKTAKSDALSGVPSVSEKKRPDNSAVQAQRHTSTRATQHGSCWKTRARRRRASTRETGRTVFD